MQENKPDTVPGLVRELSRVQLEQERTGQAGLWTSTSREPAQDLSDRSLRARLWREISRTVYATAEATSTLCRKRIIGQVVDQYGRSKHTVEKDAPSTIAPSTAKYGGAP